MAQCTAKARSTGERCQRNAVTNYSVCQVHGAGSPLKGRPGGIHKTPPSKGGRYSKFLPARLADRFDDFEADAELLSMRQEIALLDSRISDVLDRVDTGEAGKWWNFLQKIYGELIISLAKNDSIEAELRLQAMGKAIEEGVSDYAAWDEIIRMIEQRRKLVAGEQRRVMAASHTLRMDEAARLMSALASAVREYVKDEDTLGHINKEFIRLSEIPSRQGIKQSILE